MVCQVMSYEVCLIWEEAFGLLPEGVEEIFPLECVAWSNPSNDCLSCFVPEGKKGRPAYGRP